MGFKLDRFHQHRAGTLLYWQSVFRWPLADHMRFSRKKRVIYNIGRDVAVLSKSA